MWAVALAGVLSLAQGPAVKNDVVVDGHHLAVWEKHPADPSSIDPARSTGGRGAACPTSICRCPVSRDRSWMRCQLPASTSSRSICAATGRTARDETGYLTPDRAVADVAGVVDWVRQRQGSRRGPVYLFGLSRGAMIAAMAAQARPETIAGVVLLGFGFDPDVQSARTAAPARAPRTPNTEDAAAVRLHHPGRLHAGDAVGVRARGAARRPGLRRVARRGTVQRLCSRPPAGAGAARSKGNGIRRRRWLSRSSCSPVSPRMTSGGLSFPARITPPISRSRPPSW